MQGRLSKYEADLLRGNTECLLLFLIMEEQYTYGYKLIKEIEKRSEGYFQFKEGTVYPALHRLENEGLIQGEWQKPQNGQEKRYYRITEKGKQVLREKLAAWQGFTTALNLVFKPTKAQVTI
jgi:PadR family transcriptional regulator PadR